MFVLKLFLYRNEIIYYSVFMVYFEKWEKYLIAPYEPQEDKVDLVKEDDIIKEVYIHLTPLTASQEDKQYVSLTLVIKISQGRFFNKTDP